jgi:hypothetical protein
MKNKKKMYVNKFKVMSIGPKNWIVALLDMKKIDDMVTSNLLTKEEAKQAEKILKKTYG